MCTVPLPYHASAPHRFSLATLPVRSGVRNDGEKITIRVAEPDDLGAPRMTTTPAPCGRPGNTPVTGRESGTATPIRVARRVNDSCQPPARATSPGLAMGPLGTRLNERGSGRGVVGRFTRGASEATRRIAMVGEASVARGALSAARCATAGSPGTPPRSEWRSRCPACRVSSWC